MTSGGYHPAMTLDDVRQAASAVRHGELSARELVQVALDRVADEQQRLNAFVHVDAEGALAAADAIDRARAGR